MEKKEGVVKAGEDVKEAILERERALKAARRHPRNNKPKPREAQDVCQKRTVLGRSLPSPLLQQEDSEEPFIQITSISVMNQ